MLAFGIISEVFADKGLARVSFPDLDNMVSQPLPISVPKTLNDKFSIPFDINEHVWCLMDASLEYGVIGGAIYSTRDTPVAGSVAENIHIAFAHGLSIDYNRNAKTLSINGTGNVKLDITGNAEIKCTDAYVEATTKIELKAPVVKFDAATVTVTGLLNVAGMITGGGIATSAPSGGNTGDAVITGKLQIAGDIIATGDVKSGTVNLKTHVHGGVQTGPGTSAPPTP
jgi:phage baseplate assembly protein V